MEGINSLARERQVLPLETVHLAQHTQGRSKTQIASTPPKDSPRIAQGDGGYGGGSTFIEGQVSAAVALVTNVPYTLVE